MLSKTLLTSSNPDSIICFFVITIFAKLFSEIDDVFGAEKIVKHGLPVELFHSHCGSSSDFKNVNKKKRNIKLLLFS